MSNRAFLIWLCLLIPAVAVLYVLLHGGQDTPSVGGGGYDLGPFLYSWLLVLLSGLWTLTAGVLAAGASGKPAAKRAFILAGLGLLTLALTLWLHGSDLS